MVTYKVDTPQEYLAIIAEDWRRDTLLELRAVIQAAAPDWEECIHYGMLAYGPKGDPAVHLNAQKNYVGLYVGDIGKVDPDGALLGDIDRGKGCIRFKRKNVVSVSRIDKFLERYVEMRSRGDDIGC